MHSPNYEVSRRVSYTVSLSCIYDLGSQDCTMQSLSHLLYLENRAGVSKPSSLILNDMSTYVLWRATLTVVARFGDKLSVWYNSTTR
jgi:hypothetical protein